MKKTSDSARPPMPSSMVNATASTVLTMRNGKRRGAWSDSAPMTGALTNMRAIDRLVALPNCWSVPPIVLTTHSGKYRLTMFRLKMVFARSYRIQLATLAKGMRRSASARAVMAAMRVSLGPKWCEYAADRGRRQRRGA